MEILELRVRCPRCGHEFSLDGKKFICIKCGRKETVPIIKNEDEILFNMQRG
jgi:DNA-directed RNA polymerase subunit RPC12/RpoP